MTFAGAEADRRIANGIQIGVVTSVGAGTARVRLGDLETPDIPVAQLRAGALSFWWMPTVGEQVLVACPSGDVARGVVVASIYAGNAPSSDIAVPMIDLAGGRMVINGSIEVTGSIEVAGSISAAEDVRAEGSMVVAGDVTASGVSLVEHVHGGVTPGGGSTGAPE